MSAQSARYPRQRGPANDKEGGLAEFQVSGVECALAPKGCPERNIQAKLNDAVVQALDDELYRKRLLEIGSEIPSKADRTPHALQKLVESESGAVVWQYRSGRGAGQS